MLAKTVAKILIFYLKDEKPLLLVLTRSASSSAPGLGDLPGGKIEDHESIEEGAKREVIEETGLCLQELHSICSYTMPHPSGIDKIEHLFCAISDIKDIRLNPDEHSEYDWITLDYLSASKIHPVTLGAIKDQISSIEDMLLKN
ncbi:MAG: NUDIX hydrolase [Candidatus Babeliales bacterium]